MQSSKSSLARGFSLIELLIVILIISLLLSVGAVGVRGALGGKGIGSAVSTAEALFDEARSTAVGKGTTARVLIDVRDSQDTSGYLRRIVVAYKKLDKDGNPTDTWELSSRATVLPEKVFFSKVYSKKDQKTGSGEIEEVTLSTGKSNFDGRYLSYEFNSEGICTTPGASFVLGSGIRPAGQDPRVTAEGKRDFGGFVVWRKGATSILRGPEQIGIPASLTTF
jgi:prepilin-type N-terminal cleavage/methylation domain-containing protein